MSHPPIAALRHLDAQSVRHEGRDWLLLRDPLGIAPAPLLVRVEAAPFLRFLDGRHTLRDIQLAVTRATGEIVSSEELESFVETLDRHCMLDSPSFRRRRAQMLTEYRRMPARPARFAGEAYSADPELLIAQLDAFYGSGGAPELSAPAGPRPVALVAPHIDPQRGAACYAHAYHAVRGPRPRRVVILGVNHAGAATSFILTTRDYATPLGTLPTDAALVRRLDAAAPFDTLDQEDLHRWEHSIEFQALFLLHAWGAQGGSSEPLPQCVPILCSFPWQVFAAEEELDEVRAQIDAFLRLLREALAEDRAETLIVAGVDLAHVGRRFGDAQAPSAADRQRLRGRDLASLDLLLRGDREGFIAETVREGDARRLCGFAALSCLMELVGDARGTLLDYGQSVETESGSVVSFAAARFDPVPGA